MSTIHTQRYLRVLLIGTAAVLLLAVGINRLIDPFGLFDGPRIDGLNAKNPEFTTHLRMAKAVAVQRFRPHALVLGTSRGEIGIDPQHPGFSAQPVYNLSLSGSNIYEALRYLQHAHAIEPLAQAVLMLDFFMFNAVSNPDEVDFDEQRLAVSVDGTPQTGLNDSVAALASLDALTASLQTVRKQRADDLGLYRADGFRLHDAVARAEAKRLGGQRANFQQNEKGYYNSHYRHFAFKDARRDNGAVFRQLLQLVHREGIELHMAISPSHARQFETIAAKGLWPLFEDWKRMLVRINAEEADSAGKAPFPLWDFSGYNRLTTEPVPAPGDATTEMRRYWESSHYKKALGDLVLDRIFSHSHPDRVVPDDFGGRMTVEMIEPHLARIRADRQRWRAAFPQDVAEIEALGR